jgi:hypothetical protein
VDSMRALIIRCLALASFLSATIQAQQSTPTSPPPSSTTSASASGKNDSAGSDRVIIKVGSVQVTEEEFNSRIDDIEGPQVREKKREKRRKKKKEKEQ